MKFHPEIKTYGDTKYRGDCPTETVEQITLFRRIRSQWPDTIGKIAIHPRNEGERNYKQAARHKAEGMTTGAADLLIPGAPSLVLELKRRDHTKSTLSADQVEYLLVAQDMGAVVCISLGADAAMEALTDWIDLTHN